MIKELVRPYYLRWLYFRLYPENRPSHFEDCWKYPPAADLPGKDSVFLFLPMTDWHTRIQRTQHLARGFASEGFGCLYLNPHLGREFPKPSGFGSSVELRSLAGGVTEMHVQLAREPVFHHRLLRAGEVRTLADAISAVLRGREAVQIVSFPIWRPVAEELRRRHGCRIVYDCHDVLGGFENVARQIVEAERAAIESCDLALFSSRRLFDDYQNVPAKRLLVRNAVDEGWVRYASGGGAKYVDYIGALDRWFDTEAMIAAVKELPHVRFRLIGRIEDESIQLRLRIFDTVEFMGEVPHEELHRYLRESRVGLIPFKRNELTIGTNPIKLYEYFAYGLPVVSARLPEVQEYGDLVRLYDTPAEFAEAVQEALEEDGSKHEARRTVARTETWGARVRVILEELESVPKL